MTNRRKPARSRAPAADLGASFLEALAEDFREHGRSAIVKLREDKPADYLKAVATHLPAETEDDADALFAPYSDAELRAIIKDLRAENAPGQSS